MSSLAVKLTKLRIDEVSGVDRPASLLDGWLVMKARDPHALRKAQDFSIADALAVIVDRAAERAVAKAKLAEMFGTPVPTTEIEQLSAALVLKATRHDLRHPQTQRFIAVAAKPAITPGPSPDQYDGAYTGEIVHGTGNPAPERKPTAVAWSHGGASLLR